MDNQGKLWLPKMPSSNQRGKWKRRLHARIIEKLSPFIVDPAAREILKQTRPSYLSVDLYDGAWEPERHSVIGEDETDDNADEEEEENYTKIDSYSEDEGDLAHVPELAVDMQLTCIRRIQKCDTFKIIYDDPSIVIEPSMAAELLNELPRKYRKIAANTLVAKYVEKDKGLGRIIKKMKKMQEEDEDTLHFDDFNERSDVEMEIEALLVARREIIDGIFDAHEEKEEFNRTDLLDPEDRLL